MELIHADSGMRELGVIDCFERFDAQIGLLSADAPNDFELVLDEGVWKDDPIRCGDRVYIPDSEWGGIVESVRHEAAYGRVKIGGVCWRGLLARFAVVPPSGQTHFTVANMEANAMIRAFFVNVPDDMALSNENSGILCSGSVRYKNLLAACESLLSDAHGRLSVCLQNGRIALSACRAEDRSQSVEFSQEYDSSLVGTEKGEEYNHIIALGQGTMEDRQIVEMWLTEEGTVTEDGTAQGIAPPRDIRTYIYDYSSVESISALREAARKKLLGFAAGAQMEISIGGTETQVEPGDTAGVRDMLTGLTRTLTVTEKRLTISENSVKLTHTLS